MQALFLCKNLRQKRLDIMHLRVYNKHTKSKEEQRNDKRRYYLHRGN